MSKTTILIILLIFLMNNYSGSAVSLVPADKRTEKRQPRKIKIPLLKNKEGKY